MPIINGTSLRTPNERLALALAGVLLAEAAHTRKTGSPYCNCSFERGNKCDPWPECIALWASSDAQMDAWFACLTKSERGDSSKPVMWHGMSKSVEYQRWKDMICRCTQPSHAAFADYGGRGIHVCDEWLEEGGEGFIRFYEHMGPRPGGDLYSVERLDVNGHYEPSNTKWATPDEQARNKRNTRTTTRSAPPRSPPAADSRRRQFRAKGEGMTPDWEAVADYRLTIRLRALDLAMGPISERVPALSSTTLSDIKDIFISGLEQVPGFEKLRSDQPLVDRVEARSMLIRHGLQTSRT